MDDAYFERLSAMDLSFLAREGGRAHMRIGGVSVYEAEPLRGPYGGIDAVPGLHDLVERADCGFADLVAATPVPEPDPAA